MEKWTQEKYEHKLQEMKQAAHDNLWLYIEVNAKDLMDECEPNTKIWKHVAMPCLRVCLKETTLSLSLK